MEYNGVKFDAIVATPGVGKSYLCDKYPNLFVDADELRKRCKNRIPENITREELEKVKGCGTFEKRVTGEELKKEVYKKLDECVRQGKTIIASPHDILIDYLMDRKIKFCFVYAAENMKSELTRRYKKRGNSQEFIDLNERMFDEYVSNNAKENKSVVHYKFTSDEYLEEIIKKFKFDFKKTR